MEAWVWEDMNLDSEEDISEYILAHDAFRMGKHRVVVAICKDGDTAFTVDGACDYEALPLLIGAKILLKLAALWPGLLAKARAEGVTPFCYPTETDGLCHRRVKMFLRAGFATPEADGRMVCECE